MLPYSLPKYIMPVPGQNTEILMKHISVILTHL